MLGLGTGITYFNASEELPALEAGNPFLKLWLKHDTGITLNGSDVSGWNDQSGNDNHAAQATASRQPEYDSSDIKFNIGSDQDHRLDLTSNIELGQFTIIASLNVAYIETMGLMGSVSDDCLRRSRSPDDIESRGFSTRTCLPVSSRYRSVSGFGSSGMQASTAA